MRYFIERWQIFRFYMAFLQLRWRIVSTWQRALYLNVLGSVYWLFGVKVLLTAVLATMVFGVWPIAAPRNFWATRKRQAHRWIRRVKRRLTKRDATTMTHEIDVWEAVRPTLLCCNRKLQSDDVSRLIAGYHKDLLQADVMERLEMLDYNNELDDAPFPDTRTQELLRYISYYRRQEKIYNKCLDILAKDAGSAPHAEFETSWHSVLEAVVKGAALHPGLKTCQSLVKFLVIVMNRQDSRETCGYGAWGDAVIDHFFAVSGDNLLVDQLETLFRTMIGSFPIDAGKKKQFFLYFGMAGRFFI